MVCIGTGNYRTWTAMVSIGIGTSNGSTWGAMVSIGTGRTWTAMVGIGNGRNISNNQPFKIQICEPK